MSLAQYARLSRGLKVQNGRILHPHNVRCCNELAVLPEIAKSVLAVHGLCTDCARIVHAKHPPRISGFSNVNGRPKAPAFCQNLLALACDQLGLSDDHFGLFDARNVHQTAFVDGCAFAVGFGGFHRGKNFAGLGDSRF